MRHPHGGAHGGRGECPPRQERTKIAGCRLGDGARRIGQALQERQLRANDHVAVLDGRGGGNGTRLANGVLGGEGGLEVVWDGQSLRDEARLEGDDGKAGRDGVPNLVRQAQPFGVHVDSVAGGSSRTRAWAPRLRATADARRVATRMAVSSASSLGGHGPSSRSARNAAKNASPAPVVSVAGSPGGA